MRLRNQMARARNRHKTSARQLALTEAIGTATLINLELAMTMCPPMGRWVRHHRASEAHAQLGELLGLENDL